MFRIRFQDLRVEQISDSSGLFVGDNVQIRWKRTAKINQGFGEVTGDNNELSNNTNLINDPDTVDTVFKKTD